MNPAKKTSTKAKKDQSLTEKDLKKLEERFERLRDKEMEFYMEYLKSPWKLFTRSFLVGTAKGLGFFLGSAIIITLLSFTLTKVLGDLPQVGEFFVNLNDWLQHSTQQHQETYTNNAIPLETVTSDTVKSNNKQ